MIQIEVSDQDIIAQPFYLNHEQTILMMLKDLGAPVLGVLYFELDPAYDWQYTSHPLGGATYFFKKRTAA